MSYYAILLPGFWDGATGQAIARAGGANAQLVALYLMSNKDATMIGLYQARLSIVRERIGTLSAKAIERAMIACGQAGYADYDALTEHVWVREMAKYRLNLHKSPLKKDDNRTTGAQRLYEKLAPNPFLVPFFKRYRTDLHLPKARAYKGTWQPLGSPFEAPSKPVNSIQYAEGRDQKQGSGSRNQKENLPASSPVALDLVGASSKPTGEDAGFLTR